MKKMILFFVVFSSFLGGVDSFADTLKDKFYRDLKKVERAFIPGILNAHLKKSLQRIETLHKNFLSKNTPSSLEARKKFHYYCSQSQTPTNLPIDMPLSDRPFWQRIEKQYTNYQSTENFPNQSDIVIIGGGLTGTSIAYHLGRKFQEFYLACIHHNTTKPLGKNWEMFFSPSNEEDLSLRRSFLHACKSGRKIYQKTHDVQMALKVSFSLGPKVTLLDTMDLVQQASGRNGGNIHSIPEVFFGNYENIIRERYKFIKNLWPSLQEEEIQKRALHQAMSIINMAKWTRKLIAEIPQEENFQADFSPGGWLRIAKNEIELEGLKAEQELLKEANLPSTMLSPEEIEKKWQYRPALGGRFTPQDATYHPYKFAMGLVNASVNKFQLQIYTRTKVLDISPELILTTSRGFMQAKKVILATNAFTRFLIPYKHIKPVLSQIMLSDFFPNKTKGSLVTEEQGYIYYHQPEGSMKQYKGKNLASLLMGGPDVQLTAEQMDNEYYVYNMQPIQWVHNAILQHRNKVFPEMKNVPPSSQWAGPMGFTPDRIPSIGIYAKNIYMAAGFNGYGGTYTIGAGKSIAKLVLSGKSSSKVDLNVFDPHRFDVKN